MMENDETGGEGGKRGENHLINISRKAF